MKITTENIPTRFGFGDALLELGKTNPDIYVLGADLTGSVRADLFAQQYPTRFVQMGIAEQDMMGTAAGLSLAGKIPFVSTYAMFTTGRAWEQLRNTVAYSNLNVKIIAAHAGVTVGADGASHQALEDLAITRCIPNLTILVPCDYHEAYKATLAAAKINGPVVIRLGRDKVPVITQPETVFTPGKADILREGNDVTIIACGLMVYEALQAAEILAKESIQATVINNHTIKPLDQKTIITAAQKTGAVITAEEHQVIGGLGSAVAEILAQNIPVPMRMIGVKDQFGESGNPKELLQKFHLTTHDIVQAAQELSQIKN